MSPGATPTKEAPDALRTPDGLLPPVSDVGRTQGRRQDDFTFKPSGRRATKRSSDHAPAPAPAGSQANHIPRVPKSSQANHPPASYIETRSQGGINTNSRGGTVTAVICATFPSATVRLVSQN